MTMRHLFDQRRPICRFLPGKLGRAMRSLTTAATLRSAKQFPVHVKQQEDSGHSISSKSQQAKSRFPMDPEYPVPHIMRYHPPPKRKTELPMVHMSPLLWDLTRDNSPVARVYDKTDDAAQRALWNCDQPLSDLIHRIEEFKKEMADTDDKWFIQHQTPFDPQRISELDVLSTALLGVTPASLGDGESDAGGSSAPGAPDASFLRSIGILGRISDDIPLTVELLIQRLQKQQNRSSVEGESFQDRLHQLRKEVISSDIRRIKRILALVIQDHNGRMLIMNCLPDIVFAITKDGQLSPEASRFLRDLSFSLERHKPSGDDVLTADSSSQD